MAEVREAKAGSSVAAYISDPDENVAEGEADKYFRRYPTPGFGTRVVRRWVDQGLYFILIDRYAGCD
jgi:hypothetical protein